MSAPERVSPSMVALCGLVTLSGGCGLVYEVIWVKSLGLFVGQTTAAVSLVVAAFLGGLVVGSWALGRAADRATNPLRMFALLELLTGVFGVAVTALLSALPRIGDLAGIPGGGPLPLRIGLGFAAVLPPTFVMGGTLPALTRFFARDARTVGRSFGFIYALNTLGAAVGCAFAGFYAIGRFGLSRTAWIAGFGNLIVAALALPLSRNGESSLVTAPLLAAERTRAEAKAHPGLRLLLVSFTVCGFASISYEILWFRVLSNFLEASAYAFALLLTVFLLGLVLGGFWYSTRLGRRGSSLESFASIQILLAFAGFFSLILLGQGRPLSHALVEGLVRVGWGNAAYTGMFLEAGIVILAPTTLIGIAFPMVTQLTVDHLSRIGRRVGLLYSLNTLGGIAGSLVTGLLLIPALGTQRCFALVALLNACVAMGVTFSVPGSARARRTVVVSFALLLAGLLLIPRDYLIRAMASFRDSNTLAVREGKDGTLSVLEYNHQTVCSSNLYHCSDACAEDFSHRQLRFGPISYASTVMPARRYMRVLAHLPMLFHPHPTDVLEICFGTGTTAAGFARYSGLRSLSLVDLNEDVFALADYFADSNLGVLRDPRVRAIVDDGRHFLARSRDLFDVISLEPPPPQAAGAVSLYSREFYRMARARLRPGGIVAQWIPVEQQSDQVNRMLIRSMLDEFPEVTLWIPSRLEGVVLASDRPFRVDLEDWRRRMQEERVRQNLAEVGFETPEELLGSFVMGTEALRGYVRSVDPVTDDYPAAEYFLSQPHSPFSTPALLEAAENPIHILKAEPAAELAKEIEQQTRAQRILIEAHQASLTHDYALALDKLDDATTLVGTSPFTAFLHDLEYQCLAGAPRGSGTGRP